jgi:hypothetical protein
MNLQGSFDSIHQFLVCEVILYYLAYRQLSEKDKTRENRPCTTTLGTAYKSRLQRSGPWAFLLRHRLHSSGPWAFLSPTSWTRPWVARRRRTRIMFRRVALITYAEAATTIPSCSRPYAQTPADAVKLIVRCTPHYVNSAANQASESGWR